MPRRKLQDADARRLLGAAPVTIVTLSLRCFSI